MLHPLRIALTLAIVALTSSLARAEKRVWTAASGGFRTEAEFVELREGDLVRLRLATGVEKDVPMAKLSAADQQYVREQTARPAKGSASAAVARLEKQAARCHSAEEALRLYLVFREDPQTSAADRRATDAAFAQLSDAAKKKLVRMDGQWATEDAFNERRRRANAVMKAGLELLRLKQEDAFRKKFAEAADIEPDSIRADFLGGMIYLLIGDSAKAEQEFENCLRREPDDVRVLNNLALIALRRSQFPQAIGYWRKAAEIEQNQSIVQNLGRFIELVANRRFNPTKGALETATEMYATLLTSEKFQRADIKRGWFYMLLDSDSLSLVAPKTEKAAPEASPVPAMSADGAVVVGAGTGFVVAPGYILTNAHVVEGGSSFDIQTSEGGRVMAATLVAKSENPDLALLQCQELAAAPLAISRAICPRGTDIMTFGYPEMFVLGASLKATRGAIAATPSGEVNGMYLYDATINHGNSGGPVCDNHGNVVAVTTVMTRTEGKYGGGIPGDAALNFVRQNLPQFVPPPTSEAVLDWPAVDAKASPSTVLVWTRSKNPSTGQASQASLANVYEDRSCLECGGLGVLKCGTCMTGRMSKPKPQCPTCNGGGLVPCRRCATSGVDPELRRENENGQEGQVATNTPPGAAPTQTPEAQPPQTAPLGAMGSAGPIIRGRRRIVIRPAMPGQPAQTNRPQQSVAGNVKDDTNTKFTQKPLDTEFTGKIRVSLAKARGVDTASVGSGDVPFRDAPPMGALLIGFDIGYGEFFNNPVIHGVRPVYLTAHGKTNGGWFGTTKVRQILHVEARPGYAVAGLRIKAGLGIDGFTVVFMRVDGTHLDPSDSYDSRYYGGPGGGGPRDFGCDGSMIVGFFGKVNRDRALCNLGLIALPESAIEQ